MWVWISLIKECYRTSICLLRDLIIFLLDYWYFYYNLYPNHHRSNAPYPTHQKNTHFNPQFTLQSIHLHAMDEISLPFIFAFLFMLNLPPPKTMNLNLKINIHLNDSKRLSLCQLMECNGFLAFLLIGSIFLYLVDCCPGWARIFIVLFM